MDDTNKSKESIGNEVIPKSDDFPKKRKASDITCEVNFNQTDGGLDSSITTCSTSSHQTENVQYHSSSTSISSSREDVSDVDSCPYNWTEYLDINTGKPYYYNLISKRTQWERPIGYISTLSTNDEPTGQQGEDTMSNIFKATFNRKTGAFGTASDASYWETVGRPTDREGRQMSAFFDINSLDSNRQQAATVKEKLANSNIDWRAYRDKKKSDKHIKNKEWLLKDD